MAQIVCAENNRKENYSRYYNKSDKIPFLTVFGNLVFMFLNGVFNHIFSADIGFALYIYIRFILYFFPNALSQPVYMFPYKYNYN